MSERRKIGLALGSGSARGWAHIGVIQGLREEGIPIDMVCGTSIGAIVGGAHAAGVIDQLDAWVRELSWSDIIGFMDVMFPRSGLIEGEKIIKFFREHFSRSEYRRPSHTFCRCGNGHMSEASCAPERLSHGCRARQHIDARHLCPL
jgi:NTE family protein